MEILELLLLKRKSESSSKSSLEDDISLINNVPVP